jgi:hypothetical protein
MTPPDETTRREIEALLPWYAAGTLEPAQARRVEAALKVDLELARSYSLVRDELAETIRLNEGLGAPSSRAMVRLMERMDAAPARPQANRSRAARLRASVAVWRERLTARGLAWAAAAALAVIVVQAALLARIVLTDGPVQYQTAAGPAGPAEPGPVLLVGFAEQATAGEIATFLEASSAVIIDGPRAGLFRIRLATKASPDELQAIAARMRREERLIRFAVPES